MTNIAEILKDYPQGTKLYSPLFGECKFIRINEENNRWPIIVQNGSRTALFTEDGKYFADYDDSECLLWPSKDNHDWESMRKKPAFKTGDIVVTTCNSIAILDKPYSYTGSDNYWWYLICVNPSCDIFDRHIHGKPVHLANPEEICGFFQELANKGLCYNTETHVLEEIKKEPTFQPYEKVLARDYDKDQWTPQIFSHYNNGSKCKYRMCGGMGFSQCIPYEGNEHLVGTTDNPVK